MSDRPATRFIVDYTYGRAGGSATRTRLSTATSQLSNPQARSITAVESYLKRRHPGLEITILNVEFQDATGEPV